MNTQIYQVLPGRPYGRARHGTNVTLSSDPHTRRIGNGTSGSNILTLNSAGYVDLDLIIICQTKSNLSSGTEDNWEINMIVSGGGSTSLTLLNNLGRSYINAQVLDVREYQNLTINSWTISAWDGSIGASFAIADRGTTGGSGQITGNGKAGFPHTSDTSGAGGNVATWRGIQAGGGFLGGWNTADGNRAGAGEGNMTSFVTETATTGDNGGGGNNGNQGAGGGNATQGGSPSGATGGALVGNSALTSMFPGGGGGGTGAPSQDGPASGGNGGAMGWLWSSNWTNSGGIRLNGGAGGDSTNPPYGGSGTADGGGGAGGSLFANLGRGNIGSNLWQANGGVCQASASGNGSAGRIRINSAVPTANITGTAQGSVSMNFDPLLSEDTNPFFALP